MANARNYLPRAVICPARARLAGSSVRRGPFAARRRRVAGAHPAFPVSRRQRAVPGALRIRRHDARTTARGGRGSKILRRTAEFRNEGMTARFRVRHGRRSPGRIGRRAFRRFQNRRTGNSYRCERRCGGCARNSCARRRSTPSAEHAFSGVEAQGPMQAESGFVPAVQGLRASPRAGARPFGGRDAESNRIAGDGHRCERRVRYRRRTGGARRRSRPRPWAVPFKCKRARRATGRSRRTQLEFRGTVSGDALRAALSLPATPRHRRPNGLARPC